MTVLIEFWKNIIFNFKASTKEKLKKIYVRLDKNLWKLKLKKIWTKWIHLLSMRFFQKSCTVSHKNEEIYI